MGFRKWSEVLAKRFTPEEIAAIHVQALRELAEMDLAEIRRTAGKTQVEAAEILETTQSELSKLERREDHKLSTLRKYVEALGGELEIVARFGDRAYRVRHV